MSIQIKQIKSKLHDSGSLISHFIISNLSKGLGLTIGNSLRRILLSNLSGTSIIAIKIPGIFSEFSSIYGLREDVLELLLNLKEVILCSMIDEIHYGKITLQGPGVITANCITFSSFVKIINPNLYIATIYNKQLIHFDLIAIKKRGYTFNNNNELIFPTFISIDAIFMPVLSVNYILKDHFTRLTTLQESLLFEITTNGSISPNDALIEASSYLTTIFSYIKIARVLKFLK
jgi:DNA-directed RNA polymerase subunit alpha